MVGNSLCKKEERKIRNADAVRTPRQGSWAGRGCCTKRSPRHWEKSLLVWRVIGSTYLDGIFSVPVPRTNEPIIKQFRVICCSARVLGNEPNPLSNSNRQASVDRPGKMIYFSDWPALVPSPHPCRHFTETRSIVELSKVLRPPRRRVCFQSVQLSSAVSDITAIDSSQPQVQNIL